MRPILRWFHWRRRPALPPPEPEAPQKEPEPPALPPPSTPFPAAGEGIVSQAVEVLPPVAPPAVETPALPAPEPEPMPEAAPALPPELEVLLPPSAIQEVPAAAVEPPTAPPTPAPPAIPDVEQSRARMVARLGYFTPAGYTPGPARAPRLLAPGRSSPSAGIADADVPRGYFAGAKPTAAQAAPPKGPLPSADPAALSLFLLSRENDPRLDPSAADAFLRQPELLSRALKLRNEAVENWLAGRAPWGLAELHTRAMALAAHAGAALILCHNVVRSFACGGQAIPWTKTDRATGAYFDGERAFQAQVLHPLGVLRAGPFGAPSLFYLLFSAQALGTADPGDWRRYFASAALAWYVAAGPAASADPADRGWTYANAASFSELQRFGRSAGANRRAARVQLSGARFGCRQASAPLPADARWRIPVGPSVAELLDSQGNLMETVQAADAVPAPPRAIRQSVLQAIERAVQAPRAQIICTVDEGIACRLAAASWRDSLLQPLAEALVDEIGWNVLEHAVRRQASLRLASPAAPELDLGEGYRPCTVAGGA